MFKVLKQTPNIIGWHHYTAPMHGASVITLGLGYVPKFYIPFIYLYLLNTLNAKMNLKFHVRLEMY